MPIPLIGWLAITAGSYLLWKNKEKVAEVAFEVMKEFSEAQNRIIDDLVARPLPDAKIKLRQIIPTMSDTEWDIFVRFLANRALDKKSAVAGLLVIEAEKLRTEFNERNERRTRNQSGTD